MQRQGALALRALGLGQALPVELCRALCTSRVQQTVIKPPIGGGHGAFSDDDLLGSEAPGAVDTSYRWAAGLLVRK